MVDFEKGFEPTLLAQQRRELHRSISSELDKKISSKKREPVRIKTKRFLNKRFLSRPKKIIKSQARATIVLDQPVYTEDKSRFFTEAVKEDRRQLYFG